MKVCPSCGTNAETAFCPNCGANLSSVPDIRKCPNCGAESTSNFCPECGCNLVEPVQSYSAEPVPEKNLDNDQNQDNDQFIINSDSNEDASVNAHVVTPSTDSSTSKPHKSKKKLFIIIGAIVLLLIIIGSIAGGGDDSSSTTPTETDSYYEEETTETTEATTTEPTTEAPKEEFTTEDDYENVSYDNLARNPDDYEGELVQNSGRVIQVVDGETEVNLRIATASDGYDDVVLVYYDPSIVDSRILEDDNVTYYGRSKGLYTYESTMGGEITVPLVQIHKITRN